MTHALDHDLASGALHDVLADIAEAAARLILPYWRTGTEVIVKGDDSPVTIADQRAEALILERLGALYPEVQVVAEEQVAACGMPEAAEGRFWLIDPLDGTKGFIAGKDTFTVNIALIENGRGVAAAVSAPATLTTWTTCAGGARKRFFGEGWEAITVRARPERPVALVSHSMKDAEAAALAAEYGCPEWEAMDSSIKFCLVAQGAYDVYPRTGPTHEWDTAAGQTVLEAAGGQVVLPDGTPMPYGKPGFRNGAFAALGG